MITLASVSSGLETPVADGAASARTISAPPARLSIPDKLTPSNTASRERRAATKENAGRAPQIPPRVHGRLRNVGGVHRYRLAHGETSRRAELRVPSRAANRQPCRPGSRPRSPESSTGSHPRLLTALDVVGYSLSSMTLALMCAEFRGLESPYLPGMCLVLLCRSVTAQDPWRRGWLMSGAPVFSFYAVLLGSALVVPRLAAQFRNPAALTTLGLNSSYVLGTYMFLVLGGHVVWSLRRQIFEARNLGRYRLKRKLASGGMGDVWVAYHPGLKRDVAVKILRNDVRGESKSAVRRFEREARATADLQHPNTIRVFDYGATEDGLLYYVMELLDGETLADHVGRVGPLPPARAVHIIGQAARALAEAHERGIVHRDVKPENLFLTSLGGEHDFVKVLDFGIAKMADDAGGAVTRTGFLLGTPLYMSPEVLGETPPTPGPTSMRWVPSFTICSAASRPSKATARAPPFSDTFTAYRSRLPSFCARRCQRSSKRSSCACSEKTRPSGTRQPPTWPWHWRAARRRYVDVRRRGASGKVQQSPAQTGRDW